MSNESETAEIERRKLAIEEARLELESIREKRESNWAVRLGNVLLSSAIALAGILVSAAGIYYSRQTDAQKLQLKQLTTRNDEAKVALLKAQDVVGRRSAIQKFIEAHYSDCFGDNETNARRIKSMMLVGFSAEELAPVFESISRLTPPNVASVWKTGSAEALYLQEAQLKDEAKLKDDAKVTPVVNAAASTGLSLVGTPQIGFGGPSDSTYKPNEGLGFIREADLKNSATMASYFSQEKGPGLARRLKPDMKYVAVALDDISRPKGYVMFRRFANVENLRSHKVEKALLVDWWLRKRKEEDGVGLSSGLAAALDAKPSDQIRVTVLSESLQ